MQVSFTIPWEFWGIEHDVVVSGEYTPARPAFLAGPPEKCYPAESAEFVLEEWVVADGQSHEDLCDNEDFLENCYQRACDEYAKLSKAEEEEHYAEEAFWRGQR